MMYRKNYLLVLKCLVLTCSFPVLSSCVSPQRNAGDVQGLTTLGQASQKDYRFTSGTSALRIPFEEDDGHIFLQVRINDSAPLLFGLDTGAIRSIIDQRAAQSLGLKSEGTQQVGGAGGSVESAIFKGVSIKLPGVELYNQTVWGLSLDALSPPMGRRIDGIIGYELFKYFVVDVDYAALRIDLYEPGPYVYRGAGQSVPIKVEQDGEIYVQAKVVAGSRPPIEGEFVIDTGGNATLMLAQTFVEEHRLLESVGQTLQAGGGGVGGPIQLVFGRLKSFQLGGFELNNPVTGFVKVGQIADAGKAGNIGGKYLRRFRIIFDYSRQRMILEPNANFHAADDFDMSGAALAADGPEFRVMKVLRVRPNSPATEAGLRAQDVIEAVDGKPITELARLKQLLRQEGREYLLSVNRGGQSLQVRLKLRKLI
jgi:predicted aspartyl protease